MTPVPALWPDARTLPQRRTVRLDRFLVVAVVVSTALRVPGLLATPSSDEAGFVLVARSWSPTPDSLYGRYWVDRPPVLIAAYRWTDGLLGAAGPRILAAVLAAVLVVAVHLLAVRIAGVGPARLATVLTVTLLAHPDLSAWTAKGEVLGTPLVVLSCLLLVRALDADGVRRAGRLATLAGAGAMTACGFKQSLVGGLVFAAVLLVASVLTERVPLRRARPGRPPVRRRRGGAAGRLPGLGRGEPGDAGCGVVPGGRVPRRCVRGARGQRLAGAGRTRPTSSRCCSCSAGWRRWSCWPPGRRGAGGDDGRRCRRRSWR